ncbi:PREDICTED: uncharacterized protein LOC106310181 isoform X1 [Brassica oleracea var. oleracea]|uniref:uncharacterized protein LOC106310181 isoform X1 n=1 Tax=Brassica oleracea var. oleracea TaxID=109376 RepID=UPI0006A6C463|nr:PREDICTED: uncharacterized protein LOC106310181 isoform X1 [Brassica oleracea var. oleracea]XP_013602858.1 PREDICTED: uncharacterized protein LOC106310181 isoform X1 [Brassica oleracea var. oleracea]XP_013602859.1 PREDICTED: uncharacterized protein LOC106310181 isoform X1 [Brassica oleracea var. oleracea]
MDTPIPNELLDSVDILILSETELIRLAGMHTETLEQFNQAVAKCHKVELSLELMLSPLLDSSRSRALSTKIGERSAVIVLEELMHAKRRGAKVYAELCGYRMSSDAHHITQPSKIERELFWPCHMPQDSHMQKCLCSPKTAPAAVFTAD